MKSEKRKVKGGKNGISARHKPSVIGKSSTAGITLIALVITIIVLLILAGITINLTIGQDGILKRAEQAGRNYTNAADYEREQIAGLENEADRIIDGLTPKPAYTMVDGVPVPRGFTHTGEGTLETGFVIKNDEDGNEFVWVPVEDLGYDYNRYALLSIQPADGTDKATNSTKIKSYPNDSNYYTEAMPSIGDRTEIESVKAYGGFYIGRYEVGIIEYDSNVNTSNSNRETSWTGYSNGTAVIQKGKQVWNYITRNKAKEIAESMYSENDVITSRLCSSYAWDTALKFIETKYPDYPTNSTQGNYKDTTFSYTDLNGETQTKEQNTSTLVPTGQTTAVNNIYDLGGNVFEWTTEVYSNAINPCAAHGGRCNDSASVFPAAYRLGFSADAASVYFGFRSTLYL